MAAVAPRALLQASQHVEHQIVDLSDSDDDAIVVKTTINVSNSLPNVDGPASPKVAQATAEVSRHAADNAPQEQSQSSEDSEDSDSDSLVYDMLFGGEGPDEDDYVGDMCTPEESDHYKSRLHEIGIEPFVEETIVPGKITAKKLLTAFGIRPSPILEGLPDTRYFRLLGKVLIEEISRRRKLPHYNTIDDVVTLLQRSSKIIVITGAGISTNLGIPDFRSPDSGFYSQMKKKGFQSPEDIFDLWVFDEDPSLFYEFSGATFAPPGKTSPTHAFIALLQERAKLLTNYTQNIDNIESSAGIEPGRLVQCHGSWATATCRKCGHQVDGTEILAAVRAKQIAYCKKCVQNVELRPPILKRKRGPDDGRRSSKHRRRYFEDDDSSDEGQYDIPQPGVMKPDITFFHEALPKSFFERFNNQDKRTADLVIVIGTSMKVAPVSEIPGAMPLHVPHIYISRDHCDHIDFDVTLLGDCDTICGELARRAGWKFRHDLLPVGQIVNVTQSDTDPAAWRVTRI